MTTTNTRYAVTLRDGSLVDDNRPIAGSGLSKAAQGFTWHEARASAEARTAKAETMGLTARYGFRVLG